MAKNMRGVTEREKLAFVALDELETEEQVEIAKHAIAITDAVPALDPTDALLVLHELGRYLNENPGVKKDD